MDHLLWVAVVAGVALAFVAAWWLFRPRFRRDMPFVRRGAILSAAELRFYQSLLACVPEQVTVFVKIRLMDIVTVSDDAWRKYGAPGSGMHIDFVLADQNTTEALLAIELDDRSHRLAAASVRDAFKDAALVAAHIPLLRVKAAARYDERDLAVSIEKCLARL